MRVEAFGAASCVLHIYSAALTTKLRGFQRSPALNALVVTQCIAAVVQTMRVVQAHLASVPWLAGDDMMLASGLVTLMLALAMVYLALLLTYERTGRRLLESQRQLRFLADTDTLTEVPNRRHFYELATKALALSAAGKASLVMFDIDHFKQINDRFGHAEGDEALREVARCTREVLRARDVAGRIGGDEFAMLLPETTTDEAMSVAARVATRLEEVHGGGHGVPLSLSFGVVLAREGENIADALHRADQALYEAKRQGRSRAVTAAGSASRPGLRREPADGAGHALRPAPTSTGLAPTARSGPPRPYIPSAASALDFRQAERLRHRRAGHLAAMDVQAAAQVHVVAPSPVRRGSPAPDRTAAWRGSAHGWRSPARRPACWPRSSG